MKVGFQNRNLFSFGQLYCLQKASSQGEGDTAPARYGVCVIRQWTQMHKPTSFICNPEALGSCSVELPLFPSGGINRNSCGLWTTKKITADHTSKLSFTAIKSIGLDLKYHSLWKGFVPMNKWFWKNFHQGIENTLENITNEFILFISQTFSLSFGGGYSSKDWAEFKGQRFEIRRIIFSLFLNSNFQSSHILLFLIYR